MATLKTIIDRAREVLRDHEPGFEGTTWTTSRLADWVSEALSQMSALRPDLFTQSKIIPLVPGSLQTLPEDVEAIYDIQGTVVVGPDGTITVDDSDVTVADNALLRRFGKKRCLTQTAGACGDPGANYRVKTFISSGYNSREFRVEPPVPAGASVEIMATVKVCPQEFDESDYAKAVPVGCSNDAAVLDWVLHRAFSIETESDTMRTASTEHLRKFYHSIGQKYFADSRMSSGYVLGKEGSGDERSGAPRELRSMQIGGNG